MCVCVRVHARAGAVSLESFVVVCRQAQMSEKVLGELAERSVGAVLVLMAPTTPPANATERAQWRQFERLLVSRAFAFPVYFVAPSDAAGGAASSLLAAAATASGRQQLSVELPKRPSVAKADAVEPSVVTNIHVSSGGWPHCARFTTTRARRH